MKCTHIVKNNINFYFIKTKKFKNSIIRLCLKEDAREVNFTKRNFLTSLMSYNTHNYKTRKLFQRHLEDIYSPGYNLYVGRYGYNYITSLEIDYLNPKYINEDNYLDKILDLMKEILLNPNIKNNCWDEETFNIRKEFFSNYLNEYKEDNDAVAYFDSVEDCFKDYIISKRISGNHKDLESITKENIVEEYNNLFNNKGLDVYILGDVDYLSIINYISKMLSNYSFIQMKPLKPIIHDDIDFAKKEVHKDIKETIIINYYDLSKLSKKERVYVEILYSKILGGGSLSDKLSKYLRVENSLSYYSSVSVHSNDNYMYIITGVKKTKVDEALKYIDKAVLEMNTNISKQELNSTLNGLNTDYKRRYDTMGKILGQYFTHYNLGLPLSDLYRKNILNIKIDDIYKMSKKVKKIYQYVLVGDKDED